MKTCIKCGAQNNDDAIFCNNCGVNITYQQQYQPPAMSYSQSLASNPAIKLLRRFGNSPLFLCAAVLYTAVVVMTVIVVFMPVSSIFDLNAIFGDTLGSDFYDIYDSYGAYEDIPGQFAITRGIAIFSGLSAAAGPIIMCIAMWLQYFAFKNTSDGKIKTTGLTMIMVITIINFVFGCIGMGLILLIMLIMMALGGVIIEHIGDFLGDIGANLPDFNIAGLWYIIFGILIVAFIIGTVLMIIYYVKLISTIKSIITTAETGNPETKISMFVIIVNFLTAASTLITLIFMALFLSNKFFMLSSLLNAALYIIISILLISYRGKAKELALKIRAGREYNDYYGNLQPLQPQPNYANYVNSVNSVNDVNNVNTPNVPNIQNTQTEQQQTPFVPPEE